MRGSVKLWTEKAWGFIKGDDGRDYFVHISGLLNGERYLCPGDHVDFEIETNRRSGKTQAANVRVL